MDRDLRHTDPKEWAGGVNTPITEADKPHYTLSMPESWNVGVRGTQVPLLINLDADTIRCVAGPGSGKTFGLVRRVERILHPRWARC